jgi:hypothetical protein
MAEMRQCPNCLGAGTEPRLDLQGNVCGTKECTFCGGSGKVPK